MFVNITSIISTSGPECTIDMCAVNGNPIECGNGTCIGGTCDCDDDYVNIDNFCEETCVLTPCQDSDLISVPIDRKRNLHELSPNNEVEFLTHILDRLLNIIYTHQLFSQT